MSTLETTFEVFSKMYSSGSAVHLVSRVRSLGFSFVRSFSPASARWIVRSLSRSFGYPFARSDVRSLGLPFFRSLAFLVCSVVPPFAQFFLLFMGINML